MILTYFNVSFPCFLHSWARDPGPGPGPKAAPISCWSNVLVLCCLAPSYVLDFPQTRFYFCMGSTGLWGRLGGDVACFRVLHIVGCFCFAQAKQYCSAICGIHSAHRLYQTQHRCPDACSKSFEISPSRLSHWCSKASGRKQEIYVYWLRRFLIRPLSKISRGLQ
jgi:hypothetical protein